MMLALKKASETAGPLAANCKFNFLRNAHSPDYKFKNEQCYFATLTKDFFAIFCEAIFMMIIFSFQFILEIRVSK